jgi:hypothetical protein
MRWGCRSEWLPPPRASPATSRPGLRARPASPRRAHHRARRPGAERARAARAQPRRDGQPRSLHLHPLDGAQQGGVILGAPPRCASPGAPRHGSRAARVDGLADERRGRGRLPPTPPPSLPY